MSELKQLFASSNKIIGTLPSSLGLLTNLENLEVENNVSIKALLYGNEFDTYSLPSPGKLDLYLTFEVLHCPSGT